MLVSNNTSGARFYSPHTIYVPVDSGPPTFITMIKPVRRRPLYVDTIRQRLLAAQQLASALHQQGCLVKWKGTLVLVAVVGA
jgi:hypothetical protein